MEFKFGKLDPKPHKNTLFFADFLKPKTELEPPPPKKAWEYNPQILASGWGMYANDMCGDCTIASKAHIIMAVTANTGHIVIPPIGDVTSLYSHLTGYDPNTGANDTGLAMTDVYDYWLKNPIFGQKLLGWVQIDHRNREHFMQCIDLFGACDTGVQLPKSAWDQAQANQSWDVVPNDGGILGGHCVPYLGYGSEGETCITWGKKVPCGIPWFQKYCDEGYGLILDGWFDTAGKNPDGFDRDALWSALQAVKV